MHSKHRNVIIAGTAVMLSTAILLTGCISVSEPVTEPAVPSEPVKPPVIVSFEAQPPEVTSGESTTLSWKVTGATNIEIGPDVGKVSPSGQKAVTPSQRTVYTLQATNSGGTINQSVIVTVNANLKAKPIALTEEDVTPTGFIYDTSTEPYVEGSLSTYNIKFLRKRQVEEMLDNTVYVFNTVPEVEKIFAEDKNNSRAFATDFIALGTEGYVLTIKSADPNISSTYSIRFQKHNVYIKLVGNFNLNELEKFARLIESRIY